MKTPPLPLSLVHDIKLACESLEKLRLLSERTPAATIEEPLLAHEEWNDTAFRHAYFPHDLRVAVCGYDGPCTCKYEKGIPPDACPICEALVLEWRRKFAR